MYTSQRDGIRPWKYLGRWGDFTGDEAFAIFSLIGLEKRIIFGEVLKPCTALVYGLYGIQ